MQLNAVGSRHRYKVRMWEKSQEVPRLTRRIAEIRRCIEAAEGRESQAWGGSEQSEMIALLKATLKALEARKVEIENTHR